MSCQGCITYNVLDKKNNKNNLRLNIVTTKQFNKFNIHFERMIFYIIVFNVYDDVLRMCKECSKVTSCFYYYCPFIDFSKLRVYSNRKIDVYI